MNPRKRLAWKMKARAVDTVGVEETVVVEPTPVTLKADTSTVKVVTPKKAVQQKRTVVPRKGVKDKTKTLKKTMRDNV